MLRSQWGAGSGGDWTLYMLFIGTPAMIPLLFLAHWWLGGEIGNGGAVAPRPA